MQVHKSSSQQPDEGVTNREGCFEFNLKEICTIVVSTQKTGYANLARKLEITNGLLQSAINKEITFTIPMVKDMQQD